MPLTRRILPLAGLLALAAAAPASAATTIGSNLKHVPNAFACVPTPTSPQCTLVSTGLPAGSTASGGVASAIDGVVVRWRVRSGANTGESLRPRVVTATSGGPAGDFIFLPNAVAAVFTYQTRLPISKGEFFGVDAVGGNGAPIMYTAPGAGATTFFARPLTSVDEVPVAQPPVGNNESLVSADVEADGDGDGYGDETQDQCPTDKAAQGPCPPTPATPTNGTGTPATPGAPPVSSTSSGAPVSVALEKLVGSAAFGHRLRIKQVLRSGLTVDVGSSQPASVVARATLGSRTIALGNALVTSSGDAKLTLRVTKTARKRLRRARRAKLTVLLTLTDLTGRTTTLTRRVTLMR